MDLSRIISLPDGCTNNIVFISPHNNLYGAERSLVALMSYVKKQGINPILVLWKEGPIITLLKEKEIDYIVQPFRSCITMNGKKNYNRGIKDAIRNIQYSRILAKKLCDKYGSISLVYSNTIVTDFGIRLAQRLKVPHIQHIREFGKQDFNMEFKLGVGYAKYIFNKSKKIICISDAMMNNYEKIFKAEKLVRIYNGLPINETILEHTEHKGIKFLMVGRLSEEKGQEEVISACALLRDRGIKNFSLHLYGDGVDETKLSNQINRLKLSEIITLMGFQTSIHYENYDIAIIASKAEAFGRVTVEYMVHQLPVIGANAGATPEIIKDGETGILYCKGDINALANSMELLIDEKETRIKMGKNGRQRAISLFSENEYCRKVFSIIMDVLDGTKND